ncbi:MAG: PDZ domain-containing protein [Terriglobia bacterium]
MKRNTLVLLGSLLVIALLGISSLRAGQESTKSAVTVIAPGDEPDVLYFSADAATVIKGGDEPDVLYLSAGEDEEEPPAAAPSPHPMALPHPGRQTFLFRTGEGGGAWLGVRLEEVTAEKAKELKLAGEYGVIVKDVEENSPAAKAGLAQGDVILEFAGEKVRGTAHFRRLVRETPAGRTVSLQVSRAGQTRTLTAKLEAGGDRTFQLPAMPPMPDMPKIEVPEFDFVWHAQGARLGISGDDLTPQLAEFFGVKQGKGVLVREVVVGSAAAKAGLKAGDIIVAVDGKEVTSVSKLRRALAGDKEEKEARKATLTIVRDKREQTVAVELEPPEPVSPRRVTGIVGPEPEEMQELAAEAQAHAQEYKAQAGEWQKEQKEFQKEFQKEQKNLQEELRQLQEELPKEIEEEIEVSRQVV